MLKPFFVVAMLAPGRQRSFRRLAVAHVLLVSGLSYFAVTARSPDTLTTVGYFFLILGLVEGAALIGWRLTQLPKSQALEFLLTSPAQPRGVFTAEAVVGICRFALVWLAGVPVAGGLIFTGTLTPPDLLPILVMPFAWGIVAGLGLTAWVYEPLVVRRIGELFALGGVLVYLVVGVIAGENLRLWLHQLPPWLGQFLFDAVTFGHNMNPFGVVRYWFDPNRVVWIARERFEYLNLFAAVAIVMAGGRAAVRLRGHFHERHYRPRSTDRPSLADQIGERPLSWWAVRRVMEYSGRVNLWLAGGFALAYAAFLVAEDNWPPWMGRLVFKLFESWGGAEAIATALVVMAAVPAAFQYGLWDSTAQNRCRRLELLLLTELTGADYWHASLSAAWKRGRGYLFAAAVLWLAIGLSERSSWGEVLAAASGGVVLWAFSFAVGFRAFATGKQTSGLASILTLGVPLLLLLLVRADLWAVASFIPTGLCYVPLKTGITPAWLLGFALTTAATVVLMNRGQARCEADLRRWLDRNQGRKSVE